MFYYIIPVSALLLTFLSLIASMRFIFTRQGLFWILPAIISTLLCYQNLNTLLAVSEADTPVFTYTLSSFIPFILGFLWYMMIIIFHYALKIAIPENRFISDSRKNRNEAIWNEKYEMRSSQRERKEKEEWNQYKTEKPLIPGYRAPEEKDL